MSEQLPATREQASTTETSSLLATPLRQLCTFFLGDEQFGLDILDVQEVSIVPEFTKVYHAPPHVAGVVNIRGQIILCLDLRIVFDMPPAECSSDSRLILFKPTVGEDFAILVDRVGDILEVDTRSIEQRRRGEKTEKAASSNLLASALVKGICKLQDGLLLVLDSAALLRELDTAFQT